MFEPPDRSVIKTPTRSIVHYCRALIHAFCACQEVLSLLNVEANGLHNSPSTRAILNRGSVACLGLRSTVLVCKPIHALAFFMLITAADAFSLHLGISEGQDRLVFPRQWCADTSRHRMRITVSAIEKYDT